MCRTDDNVEYKTALQGILFCLEPVGEDGGLLIHPDGSAHIIDDAGDEVMFLDDVVEEIDLAAKDIQCWSGRNPNA